MQSTVIIYSLRADVIFQDSTVFINANSIYQAESREYSKASIEYWNTFNKDNFHLDLDLQAYSFDKDVPNNKNISLNYGAKNSVSINTLMVSYNNDKFGLYAGIIPFKGGEFTQLKSSEIQGGNGIELLTDQVFEGVFLSYKPESNLEFIIGGAYWQTWYNYNSLDQKNDGSKGIFFLSKYRENKNYFEFNYFNVNVLDKLNNKVIDFGNLQLFGLGYIFDDSMYSGFKFWAEFGLSISQENIQSVVKAEVPNYSQNMNKYLIRKGYSIKNDTTIGDAYILGISKDFEMFDIINTIGFEYYKTYNGWESMNSGTLFNSNNSYWEVRDGDQKTIFIETQFNNHIVTDISVSNESSNEVPKYFSASQSESINKSPLGKTYFYTIVNKIYFTLTYKF